MHRAAGRPLATCEPRGLSRPESLPAHARDGTSPQGGGPPRPRPGPGADSLQPETARTSPYGSFGTPLGRNNHEAWGGEWVHLIPRLTPRPASPASPREAISRGRGRAAGSRTLLPLPPSSFARRFLQQRLAAALFHHTFLRCRARFRHASRHGAVWRGLRRLQRP